jgi:hypothetical protein
MLLLPGKYCRAAIYIVAHQDDWQLFMDQNISMDIMDHHCRTVIIHVTSGDAGKKSDYWLARERAAVASLLFRRSGEQVIVPSYGYRRCLEKIIRYSETGNCICYFLRLPDGNMSGAGFARYGNQSLQKLRSASINFISSVDGRNTFEGFGQIVQMIDKLVEIEVSTFKLQDHQNITLHFPEHDPEINPKDHNDHLNTSFLVQASGYYGSSAKYAYVHYHIQYLSAALNREKFFWKVGMFTAYHQEMIRLQGHSTVNESELYLQWATHDQAYRQIF